MQLQTIEVFATLDTKIHTRALVTGHLGIHSAFNPGQLTVSHIPTGLLVASVPYGVKLSQIKPAIDEISPLILAMPEYKSAAYDEWVLQVKPVVRAWQEKWYGEAVKS